MKVPLSLGIQALLGCTIALLANSVAVIDSEVALHSNIIGDRHNYRWGGESAGVG